MGSEPPAWRRTYRADHTYSGDHAVRRAHASDPADGGSETPVPVGDLEITTEITRQGRNIQTIDISLSANGKEVVKTSALKIRAVENQEPEEAALVPKAPARTDEAYPFPIRAGFAQAIDLRKAESCPPGMRDAVWFRINRPFFDNGVSSALVRAAATGDFSNAFGAGIDFEVWTYINADLTLHFAREPVGEWIMLAANGWMGPDGRGLAYGELADEQGLFRARGSVAGPRKTLTCKAI